MDGIERLGNDGSDLPAWARSVVLVEGDSDAAAVHALAERSGRDLPSERIHVLAAMGVTNFARLLREIGSARPEVAVVGLYDIAEERHVARGLQRARGVATTTDDDLEAQGFFACDVDLEDELIRSLGTDAVERVLAAEGELVSFRRFQQMPHQRDRDPARQLRRFLGTTARRKIRYGRLLVESLDPDAVPRPLTEVLARAAGAAENRANG